MELTKDILDTGIEAVNFPVRIYSCIKRAGINTINDIVEFDKNQGNEPEKYGTNANWYYIRNFGRKSFRLFVKAVYDYCGYRIHDPEGNEVPIDISKNENAETNRVPVVTKERYDTLLKLYMIEKDHNISLKRGLNVIYDLTTQIDDRVLLDLHQFNTLEEERAYLLGACKALKCFADDILALTDN